MNQPLSKRQTVLRALANGPATTGEVAIETGYPPRIVAVHLQQLLLKKRITREPFKAKHPSKSRWLWRLPS